MPGQWQALGPVPETEVLRQLLDTIQELPLARGRSAMGKMPAPDFCPTRGAKIITEPNLGPLARVQ